ncbi:YjiH family protein [Paracoccus sp. MBLB3053]|uniref:YjiH family protein n=1 Tax=Paracoccus aurantius TaxID=3073814 RepID=A0ABU2HZX4_9RHOB|nr:YjiH family protein [Paracoccus sp. MBLB3053]MDS9470105.1 YjiH family protein [Paracoccus sp. MBLB3053]
MTDIAHVSQSRNLWLKFALPSILGAVVFLAPIPNGASFTIPFGILIDWVNDNFGTLVSALLIAVTVISAAATIAFSVFRLGPQSGFLAETFRVSPAWLVLRTLGAAFCLLYFTGTGPAFVTADSTGGTVVGFLMKNLLALFFFAAIALPLLTDYGFMEFVGAFMSRIFKRLFRLPGRAAIDGLASWLGAAPVGVMLTVQQYDMGVYNRREAATVATTFSIVSVPFCYVIAKVVGLQDIFFSYYASVVFIGFVCALILPRIPPLSRLPETFAHGRASEETDVILPGETAFQAGIRMGLARADAAPGPTGFLKNGVRNLIGIWFGLVPATLAVAMIALILAEYTPLFTWLSMPFVPVLEWFNVAEAQAAAPALVIGFADMYLPALIGAEIASQETRFLIAILSVSQLIYMSEVGALLLRANLGLNLGHLAMLFVIRTIIATPIAIFLAKVVIF